MVWTLGLGRSLDTRASPAGDHTDVHTVILTLAVWEDGAVDQNVNLP